MKAVWKEAVVAESDDTVVVEGNHYFPRDSVNESLLEPSATTSHCPWKGDASYYSLRVGSEMNRDAVWTYPDPKPAAREIAGRVAFWRGVEVVP